MTRQFIITMIYLTVAFTVKAQQHKLDHYAVSVTTLHTNLPFRSFASLFAKEYHPGFEVSTGFIWKEKPKHAWFQEFQSGYSYQRWVQHSVSFYTSAGYRYKLPKRIFAGLSIGAGYLHAFADSKIFKLKSDGSYQQKFNWGRPQAMAALTIGIGKTFAPGKSVFLNYQQRLQTPFIKSYVPVLPANALQLGVTVPLHKK